MTRKLRLTSAVAMLVLVGAGAQFAIAQSNPRTGAAQGNATTESTAARKVAPQSRAIDRAALHGNLPTIVELTKDECKGLGGAVGDPPPGTTCAMGKMCYTAGSNGVVHSACITEP